MARFHLATIAPTKADLIAAWAPTQAWGPEAEASQEVIGSFRFDDPDGRVGIETHVVRAGEALYQVPLTYRDEPDESLAAALISTMEHSVLGTRWVYDGLQDPVCTLMFAAVTMTGQGEALGMAIYDDRWYIAPSNVRIAGGGWGMERVPVDGFALVSDGDDRIAVIRSESLELRVHRRLAVAPRPPIALTATWETQSEPVLLAEIVRG